MNSIEIVVTIVSSVLSGLVGGLFTFLGVKATLKHEDKIRKEKEEKDIRDNCLRLEIIDDLKKADDQSDQKYDILLSKFTIDKGKVKYENHFTTSQQLTIYSIVLKNVGNTEICDITFSSNYKENLSVISNSVALQMINNDYNSLFAFSDISYIKPGDSFQIRIALFKDDCIYPNMSGTSLLTIWMRDIRNNRWAQGFNPSQRKSSICNVEDGKDYHSMIQSEKVY